MPSPGGTVVGSCAQLGRYGVLVLVLLYGAIAKLCAIFCSGAGIEPVWYCCLAWYRTGPVLLLVPNLAATIVVVLVPNLAATLLYCCLCRVWPLLLDMWWRWCRA